MKTHSLVFLFLFAAAFAGFSQSLRLFNASGQLKNGDEMVVAGPPDTLQLITWLHIANVSGNTIRVHMKKEQLSMLQGTVCSICWAGYCYNPGMMVSSFPLVMAPAETDTGCFTHYGPNGQRGTSVVRWTFFNAENPDDSISITVHYATYPAAVGDPAGSGSLLRLGPNPATGNVVFRYAIPSGRTGQVELLGASGHPVRITPAITGTGTLQLNVSDLPSGVYLCALKVDGITVSSRKLIVLH